MVRLEGSGRHRRVMWSFMGSNLVDTASGILKSEVLDPLKYTYVRMGNIGEPDCGSVVEE